MNDNVKRLTRKIAILLLSAAMLFACAAFAACTSTGDGGDGTLTTYTISFYEEDGKTLIGEFSVYAGETVSEWRLNEMKPKTESKRGEGYGFVGWGKIENVNSDLKLVAEYAIIKYKVSFYEEDGKTLIAEKTVNYGGSLTESDLADVVAPATNADGLAFGGWGEITDVKSDLKIVAEYGALYTVSFRYDGTLIGTVNVRDTKDGAFVPASRIAEMSAALEKRFDVAVDGWTYDGAEFTATTDITESISVEAAVTPYCTFTFKGEDGSVLSSFKIKKGGDLTEEQVNSVAVPQKEGYTFNGWGFASKQNVQVGATYKLTAESYTAKTYTVEFFDCEKKLSEGYSVTYGTKIAVADFPAADKVKVPDGYVFVGWGTGNYEEITVTTNLKFNAQYKVKEYTVKFYDENGTSWLKDVSVAHGGSVSASDMPALSKTGYTHTGWVKTEDGSEVSLSEITSDLKVKAQYTPNTQYVKFYVDGKVVHTAEVKYGQKLSQDDLNAAETAAKNALDNNAASGYTFGGWARTDADLLAMLVKSDVNMSPDSNKLGKKDYTVSFAYGGTTYGSFTVKYQEKITQAQLQSVNTAAAAAIDANKQTTGLKFKGWNVSDSAILNADVTGAVTYNAQVAPFRTVTFEGATDGSIAATLEVFKGENLTSEQFATVEPAEKTGKDFDYWTIGGAKVETAQILAAAVTENVTYKPVYKTKILYVTFYDSTADNAEVYVKYEVEYNGSISSAKMPAWEDVEGVDFYYWGKTKEDLHDNAEPSNKVTSLSEIIKDTPIYAITNVTVYDVTFTGDDKDDCVVKVAHGSKIDSAQLSEINGKFQKDGYDFDGWTFDGDTLLSESDITSNTVIKEGIVYTAKYTKVHTVTVNNYDGAYIGEAKVRNGESITADKLSDFTDSATREGYKFAGFKSGDVTLSTSTVITANVTFTATYTVNQYKVTFKALDSSTGLDLITREVKYDYGTELTPASLAELANSTLFGIGYYTFKEWSTTEVRLNGKLNGTIVDYTALTSISVPANDDTVLYAVYTANEYYADFVGADGNVIEELRVNYTWESRTFTKETLNAKSQHSAVNKEGYSFKCWKYGESEIDMENDWGAPCDYDYITLYPAYTVNQYKVIFCDEENGEKGYIEADYNSTVSAETLAEKGSLVPKTGYTFKGWSTAQGGTTVISSLTVPAKETRLYPVYYANVTFTVNGTSVYVAQVDIGGTLSSDQITAAETEARKQAEAESYDFDGWNESTSSVVTAPATITAALTKLYTVTFMNVEADGTESVLYTYKVRDGNASPDGTKVPDGSRTSTDYRFKGWTTTKSITIAEGVEPYSTAYVLTLAVTGNITYYAAFEQKVEYYVQVSVQGYRYEFEKIGSDLFKEYFPYDGGTSISDFTDYEAAQIPTSNVIYTNKTAEFKGLVADETGNFVRYDEEEGKLVFKGFKNEPIDLSDFTSALPVQYKAGANSTWTIGNFETATYYLDANEDELGFALNDAFYGMYSTLNPILGLINPILGLTRNADTGIVGLAFDVNKSTSDGYNCQAAIRLRDNAKELYEDVVVKFSYRIPNSTSESSSNYLYVFANSAWRDSSSGGADVEKGEHRIQTNGEWKTDVISIRDITSTDVENWYSINFTSSKLASEAPYQLIIESITYVEKGSKTYSGKDLLDITAPSYTSGQNNSHNVSTEKVALVKDGDTDVVRYTGTTASNNASPVYGMLIDLGNFDTSNYSSIKLTFKASKDVTIYANGTSWSRDVDKDEKVTIDILESWKTGYAELTRKDGFSGTLKYVWIGTEGELLSSNRGSIQIDLYSIVLTAESYTVTFKDDVSGADSTYTYGTTLTAEQLDKHYANAAEGQEFVGWATSSTAGVNDVLKGGDYTVTAAATLYPVFKAAEYTVEFKNDGTSLGAQTVTHGNSVTSVPDATKAGHKLAGWIMSDDTTGKVYSNDEVKSLAITGHTTFTAKYLLIIAVPTIASKTYTGETLTAYVPESEYYMVTKNEGGVNVGSYDVELTITETDKYTFENDFTATLKFEITKAAVTFSGMPTTITTTCGTYPEINGVTANSGATVTFVYSASENGTYLANAEIKHGDMYVKAYAPATDNYNEGYSEPALFTVDHSYSWVESEDRTQDIYKCVCGTEDKSKIYNKVVTATNELLMASGESVTLSLAGIEYDEIVSVKFGNLITYSTSLTITASEDLINNDLGHGLQNFTVVVRKDGAEHTINVPVTLITGVVTDWATFLHTFQSHTGNYEDGFFGKGTYYVLGCDIEAGSADSHTYEGNTYNKYTTNPNDSTDNYYWHGNAETVYYGFAGVLDGRGYAITNISAGYGIFGVMKGGTIKNIDFTVKEWTDHSTGTSLFGPLHNVTVENVNITFKQVIDMPLNDANKGHGVITGQQATGNTFKNINVYAPGSVLDCLVMQGGTVSQNTFENVNFYAKSFERFASDVDKAAWQESAKYNKVTFTEVADFDVTSMTVGTSDKKLTVTKPAAFNEYTLKALRYGSASVMTSDGMLDVTKFAAAVGAKAGTYTLFITLEKDGHEIRLPMTAVFEGCDVEDIYVLSKDTTGSIEITLPELFDGYEVTAVKVGGNTFNVTGSALSIESFKAAVENVHGAHDLVATLTNGDDSLDLTFNTILVTDVVTDWATFLHTFQTYKISDTEPGNNGSVFGAGTYYVLGCDIEAGDLTKHTFDGVEYTRDGAYWYSSSATTGFAGTLDGRGYAIKNVVENCGMFGVLNGATIKNIDFTVSGWTTYYSAGSLLGPMFDCTLENVNITFNKAIDIATQASGGTAIISGQHAQRTTFKNINVYAPGSDLDCLVTQHGYSATSNTYENIKFYVNSYLKVDTGTVKGSLSTTYPGITVVEGISSYDVQSATIGEDYSNVTVTKPARFSEYTLKALRYNGVSLLTSEGTLDVKAFLKTVEYAPGTYTLFIKLQNGAHEVRLPMFVTFEGLGEQDIFVEADGSATSIAIDLPDIFEGYRINGITANGTPVMTGDKLDVAAFEAVTDLGTKQALTVTLDDNNGTSLNITVNAMYVSEVITSWEQFRYLVTYHGGGTNLGEGKYYVLGSNIVGGNPDSAIEAAKNSYNGKDIAVANPVWGDSGTAIGETAETHTWKLSGGFAGTLDGLGHSITGIAFTSTSIFGTLNGGTVKNITLEGQIYSWAWSIFAGSGNMINATIENVNVTILPGDTSDLTSRDMGIIGSGHFASCTFRNLTVHAEGLKFKYLIAAGDIACATNTAKPYCNTYENCNFYVGEYAKLGPSYTCMASGVTVYTDLQEIVLPDDDTQTVSIAFPSVLTDAGYYGFRLRVNGVNKAYDNSSMDGVTASYGGTEYKAVNFSAMSVADIKAIIGDNYDTEYIFEVTLSTNGSSSGFDKSLRIRVKFTKPAEA